MKDPFRESERLEFEKLPTPSTFRCWQLNFRTEVCSGSCHPSDAMSGIEEVEAAQTIDNSSTSHSSTRNQDTNLEMSNAKIKFLKKKGFLPQQKAQKANRCCRGRQIAYVIQESFRNMGTEESILDFSDLTERYLSRRRHARI